MFINVGCQPLAEDTDYIDLHDDPVIRDGISENITESQKLQPGSLWGWCQVEVVVTLTDPSGTAAVFVGREMVSACSYISERDFVENCPYLPGMVKLALEQAIKSMGELCSSSTTTDSSPSTPSSSAPTPGPSRLIRGTSRTGRLTYQTPLGSRG